MPSTSESNSQTCVWCGRNGWLLRTERFLSASCMGWCLQASFKEHPKSTTIACAGGASSIYLANFFLSHLASRPVNERLLRAGGLISVAGVSVCLNIAFDQHPKAAIKACLAGALSMCLTKSVIFSDPSASLEEKPKIKTTRRVRDVSDMDFSYSPLKLTEHVTQIGQELIEIANYFDRLKSETEDIKEDENNNMMSVKNMYTN